MTPNENQELYVWIDGELLNKERAAVSVWDHGFLYGDGVYEGIRSYAGAVHRLDDHIERLFESAKSIQIDIQYSQAQIGRAVGETLLKNSLFEDAHVRIVATRGVGKPGLDPRRAVKSTTIVMSYPFPKYFGEKAVRLLISSVRKKSPYSVDAKLKSLNYMDSVLAKLQANAAQMDDAILLDMSGYVAEATGMNVFVVKDNKISVPTTGASLEGITRKVVLEIASRLGFSVAETNITPHDLYVADEAFLTGTGAGIVPIDEVDGRKVGKGARIVLKRILEEYTRDIHDNSVNASDIVKKYT
ncbi:MAG TPA: branched-chain-amino-acid transaminase [Nitrososphaerales archaeon]|nr:branched-chain-amino-acid transaminase [Nitrososphaerales archaeon]